MNIVILGCGSLGTAVGARLGAAGHQVLGVRRRAHASLGTPITIVTGDASDETLFAALSASFTSIDAVLLAANPGLRRGRDNGLQSAAGLVRRLLPDTRFVYTGSTAVYADADGAEVDEDGALDAVDPAKVALAAIEREVVAQAHGLVLRASALVGPTRTHALERVRACAVKHEPCVVHGSLDRPFSFVHEEDLAQFCCTALLGGLGTGILNASSPVHRTLGDYYAHLRERAGVSCEIRSDGSAAASRWVAAARLQRLLPDHRWLDWDGGGPGVMPMA